MRKINKIVLSVCCVAASLVIIYVSKQRTMVSDIISINVEALVAGDPGSDDEDYSSHGMYQRSDTTSLNKRENSYASYFYRNGQQVFIKNTNLPMCGQYVYTTNRPLYDEDGKQMVCYY